MNLDEISAVVELRDHRAKVLGMMGAVRSGPIYFHVMYSGQKFEPMEIIGSEAVRGATLDRLDKELVRVEQELAGLGVSIPPIPSTNSEI